MHNQNEEKAEDCQRNHIGPEKAVLNGFSKELLAAYGNQIAVVFIRWIDLLQREIDEAIVRFRCLSIAPGIVIGSRGLRP